jgi:hypothetical protein
LPAVDFFADQGMSLDAIVDQPWRGITLKVVMGAGLACGRAQLPELNIGAQQREARKNRRAERCS